MPPNSSTTSPPPATADRERLHRALRLALDPAAPPGEQQAAAFAVVRIARERGWDLKQLLAVIAPQTVVVRAEPERPWGWFVTLRFGKFRGYTIGRVAEEQPSYLVWAVENMTRLDDGTRRAMESVLDWIRGNAA